MNRIQFQSRLLKHDFFKRSSSEVHYEAELEQARRPQGLTSTCCSHTGHNVFKTGPHKTFQYRACRHQTSHIAGALFQNTTPPLKVWFMAAYLTSPAKTGLSGRALKRKPGVSYSTERLIQRKLRDATSPNETGPTSWSLFPAGIARTPDSGQLKPLDNQESGRNHDSNC